MHRPGKMSSSSLSSSSMASSSSSSLSEASPSESLSFSMSSPPITSAPARTSEEAPPLSRSSGIINATNRVYNSISTDDKGEEGAVVRTGYQEEEEEVTPLLVLPSSQAKQKFAQNSHGIMKESSPTTTASVTSTLIKLISAKYSRHLIYLLASLSCCLVFFYNRQEQQHYHMQIRPIMEHHADHLKLQTKQVQDVLSQSKNGDIITSNIVYSTLVHDKEKKEENKEEEKPTLFEQHGMDVDVLDSLSDDLQEAFLQKEGDSIYDYKEMITNHPWKERMKTSSPGSSSSSRCQYIDIWSQTSTRHKLNMAKMIETSKRDPSEHWVEIPCTQLSGEEGGDDENILDKDIQDDAAVISIHLPPSYIPSSTTAEGETPETKRRQTILGFGGAITEATSLNWRSLSGRAQNLVMQLFYNSRFGLGFTLGRVPINSCDFAVENYNYDNIDGDFLMSNFDTTVAHDVENGMINMIQQAQSIVQQEGMYAGGAGFGEQLKLVATPWSPPPWMKRPIPGIDKNNAAHAGGMDGTATPDCLKDGTSASSRYAKSWANYFRSFLDAYKSHGIDIWAVTIQNEPVNVDAQWENCAFSPRSEEEFIVHHLGPILRKNYPDVKILVYDSNREDVVSWMNYLWRDRSLDDKKAGLTDEDGFTAARYMDGIAMHWYSNAKPSWMLDGALGTPNMHRIVEMAYYYQRRLESNMENQKQFQLQLEREEKNTYNLRHSSTTLEAKTKTGAMDNDDNIMERLPILLDTEATHCSSTGYAIGDIDVSWYRAERNAHAMLSQLAAGSNGWIEWNMVLDPIGGPNHVENFCDAPIVAVPHRAQSAVEFQLMPEFEHYQLKEGEVIMGEYETKFTLGSKMGYPPSYIDAGIIVQPMFYYTGHLSRYVRPGSTPLMALVGQSPGGPSVRTFRPAGQTTPGGGNNDNARKGMEVTVWPCEGSTRQSWKMGGNGQLQTHRLDGYGNKQCLTLKDSIDATLGGLVLVDCGAGDAASFTVVTQTKTDSEEADVVKFMTMKRRANECLGILPLANSGGAYGPRGGAQAVLLPCDHESAIWHYSSKTGEVESKYFSWDGPEKDNGVCLTTGWPFLQAGAFDTSGTSADSDIVVVVLNEANEDANFVLSTPRDGQQQPPSSMLKATIPAHSIQTILL